MCTLSWLPSPFGEGYALAFNRDERRSRLPAIPPEQRVIENVAVLLPTDGEAGGTWIAVNELGHTVALLNRWEETPVDPDGAFVSRGLLVLELAPLASSGAVDERLTAMPLPSFRPFTVVSVADGGIPWAFEWNGRALVRSEVEHPGLVRTSSGADQAGAERVRGEVFREAALRRGGLTPEVLELLHRSHRPSRGALSICMHRDDAATVSGTFIRVTAEEVRMRYVDGPPCEGGAETELSIPRVLEGRSL